MIVTRRRLRDFGFGLVLLAGGLGFGVLIFQNSHAQDSNESKLRQLLIEKRQVLQQIVTQKEVLHKLREVGHRELYEARVALHRAQFDLCESNADRIKVLEQMLDEARTRENLLRELPRPSIPGLPEGAVTLNVEEARVDRLNVEIELERLRSK